MSWLSPANLDFVQISSVGCVQTFDFCNKLVVYSVFPVICFLAILVVSLSAAGRACRCRWLWLWR